MAKNPYEQAIEIELKFWPGVTHEWGRHRKHRKLHLIFNGQERWSTVPTSSSDNVRGPKNNVTQIKRTLMEMGAKRRDAVPVSKREREEEVVNMADNAPIRMGVSDNVTVIIPKSSEFYSRFADKNDKAVAHWALELRANPDIKGEPFVAVVKKTMPAGKKRVNGLVGGTFNRATSGFQLTIAPGAVPAIVERLGQFRTTPVEVSQGPGELILKLPQERQPPILRGEKRLEALTRPEPVAEEPPSTEESMPPEPQGEESAPPMAGLEAMAKLLSQVKTPDRMTLQFPERPLTVERCVNFLNQRVNSRGKNNLRILLDQETGMISYIEKGGPAY